MNRAAQNVHERLDYAFKESGLGVFADFHDGLAAIAAALLADMMRDMILATGFTDDQMIERQRVVRTAAVTTAARMFALG